MNYTNLRRLDLNLLAIFQSLMEERSVTRAARRLFLTQPAVSHAFDRLQEMFKDPLLVRSSGGYEPTSRALMAYAQLEKLLPQVESVISGPRFDPREAPNSFTLSASDSTCLLIVPALARALVQEAPKVYVQVLPYDGGFRRLETNEVDLILSNNFDVGVWTGSPVRTESLFQEDWGCLVRKGHPSTKRRLTLRRYLKEKHVAIAAAGPRQRLVEEMLDKLGRHREVRLTLPYSLAVGPVAEQTNLIATLPKRVALRVATPGTQIIPAPAEFKPYTIMQVWHPRDDSDTAHQWLRGVIRGVTAELS